MAEATEQQTAGAATAEAPSRATRKTRTGEVISSGMNKFKEIQELSSEELQTKKRDMRQESLHLRLQQQSGQLEQPSRLKLLRRQVAQLETVLSERAKKTETK